MQFTGANLVTLTVYAGLGVTSFLVTVQLQVGLGYSALAAGAALLPVTVLVALLSARAGALAQRIGPAAPDDRRAARPSRPACCSTPASSRGAATSSPCCPAPSCSASASPPLVAPLTATVLASVELRTRPASPRA